jgi:hypothetical protein
VVPGGSGGAATPIPTPALEKVACAEALPIQVVKARDSRTANVRCFTKRMPKKPFKPARP